MPSSSDALIGAQLRRLPALAAPVESWARIEQRLNAPAPRLARRSSAISAVVASICVLGVALVWLSTRAPGGLAGAVHPSAIDIDQLVWHSQRLEATLQDLPQRPALERASTAAVIDELQNRIQRLDAQLANGTRPAGDDSQRQRMWSERVRLLHSLVDVRYAEALRDSHLRETPTGDLL